MEGTRLGPYHVLAEVGSGGMGRVYRAEVIREAGGLEVGTTVALKVIHAHLLQEEGFFQRFLREADIGRSVQHENVVRTHLADALLREGVQENFLVMEYVEGQTLRDLLGELERVPEDLCRHIGRQVAQGLAAIHAAGVVHRDLKPENVLITSEHIVKVMDLGVAKLQDEAIRLSQAGTFVGSLEYAAPEQLGSANGEPDGRADLHALGVLLYELATGQHPYRDDDAYKVIRNILDLTPRRVGEINPQVSPFFEEVVRTLVEKARSQRFPSASELAVVLMEGEKSPWWKERAKALRLATSRPLRRIRIPRETSLYGRADDLAKLGALYHRSKTGDGQVLLIEGEAGIGKTRLVDEFVGRLRQEGEDINFLFGSYPPGGAATASGAFSDAYREQLGADGLQERLAHYLETTPILVPAFAALLRGETTPTAAEPLTKDSLQTVFVHLTRGLAAERATIILIDDLHFAPEDGRALFASLTLAVPNNRILLIGTMRPGVPEDWIANVERQEHALRTTLARLGPKDLTRLLKDAFRSERLAAELGFRIAEKSDGNPFFAFEIIRGLREDRFIARQPDGTWVTTRVIEEIAVPSSVKDLVDARIAGLADDERSLLEVGSCCGFEFDPELAGAVLGLAPIPALQRLGRVEKRSRIVRSLGVNYVFDHHPIQEMLYAGLNDRLRKRYHTAIAKVLEVRGRDESERAASPVGASCVRLIGHHLRGVQPEGALPHLDAALTHLEESHLHGQAIGLAEEALAQPGLLEGVARARLLLRVGGGNGSYASLGRYASAEQACSEVERWAADVADDRYLARAACALGSALYRMARWDEAEAALQRSITSSRRAGDPMLECKALTAWGNVHYYQGHKSLGMDRYEEALALSRAAHDESLEATLHNNLGNVCAGCGRFEEARRHLEHALATFARLDDAVGKTAIAGNLAALCHALGRLEEALHYCEDYATGSQASGRRWGIANAASILGEIQLGCGRLAEAETQFRKAMALYGEIGVPAERALAQFGVAKVMLMRDDRAAASVAIAEVLEVARELQVEDLECDCILSTGLLHYEAGRREAARDLFQSASALGEKLGVPDVLVLAPCHLALVSPAAVEPARVALRSQGAHVSAFSALDAHALLWKATGEHQHLLEAKRVLDHLVQHAPEACRDAMLAGVRPNREIVEAWKEQLGDAAELE